MDLLKAPIFLLGAHKSGTSFLRSLLDGHPALAVLQKEGHYFQCAGCWTNYPARPPWRLRLDSHHITPTEWLEGLQREHQEGFDRFSDNPQFHGYDLETAKSLFGKMRDARSEAERISLFLSTLLRASSEPAFDGSRRVVEKSVEHAHFAPLLHVLFPDAYFLHIVRDPYTALASFRRSRTAKRYPYLLPLASSLERSLLQVSCNQRILPRYRVIRYEDLAANVKSEMDREIGRAHV
jgi:protein-tyrosine sulfotransferase